MPLLERQASVSRLQAEYRRITPALDGIRNQMADLRKQKTEIEKQIPYSLTTESTLPRTTRVLPRGNWLDDSGEIVEPMIPSFLGRSRYQKPPSDPIRTRTMGRLKGESIDGARLCQPPLGTPISGPDYPVS